MLTFDQLRILQKDFAEKGEILDRNILYHENRIQELLTFQIQEIQNKFGILINIRASLLGGSHVKNWCPKIYLRDIRKNNTNWYWNYKYGWFISKEWKYEYLDEIELSSLPISEEIWKNIIKDFSIFEIPVEIVSRDILEREIKTEISL